MVSDAGIRDLADLAQDGIGIFIKFSSEFRQGKILEVKEWHRGHEPPLCLVHACL